MDEDVNLGVLTALAEIIKRESVKDDQTMHTVIQLAEPFTQGLPVTSGDCVLQK